MNLEEARTRMIAQQLRTWDVFDNQVLEAVRQSARELFVPKDYYDFAFADMEITKNDIHSRVFCNTATVKLSHWCAPGKKMTPSLGHGNDYN